MPRLCVGAPDGTRCGFGSRRTRCQVAKGILRCKFCDTEKLEEDLLLSGTRKPILNKFKKLDEDLQKIISSRIPKYSLEALLNDLKQQEP